MRYFGGGIGHLQSTLPQQVPGFDPIDPGSEEMAVEEDDDDDEPCTRDVLMNDELVQLEVGEDDEDEDDEEDDEDSEDEGGDQTDEDEDEEGEDDYGYACP